MVKVRLQMTSNDSDWIYDHFTAKTVNNSDWLKTTAIMLVVVGHFGYFFMQDPNSLLNFYRASLDDLNLATG